MSKKHKKRVKRYQPSTLGANPSKKGKFGFIKPEIVPEDFWLGSGLLGSQEINPIGNWIPCLPEFELQNRGNETNCCVSFGTLSALEMLYKFQYKDEPNYSDRFLCRASDTDPNGGNNPKKVSDTLRHNGTVPEEEYPFVLDLQEFFQTIPENIKTQGIDWLKNYEVGYEYVQPNDLKNALRRSPVGCAVSAWQQNDKGEYIKFGASNHWVVLVAFDEKDRPVIYDSYESKLKTLAKDFVLDFPQIYKLTVKKNEELKKEYTSENHYRVMLKKIWEFIKDIWFYLF